MIIIHRLDEFIYETFPNLIGLTKLEVNFKNEYEQAKKIYHKK